MKRLGQDSAPPSADRRNPAHGAPCPGRCRLAGMSIESAAPQRPKLAASTASSNPTRTWAIGAFPLPDGGTWEYREPDAVVLVRNGWLQVAAVPYTRAHDRVQILDNAKHMYFSKERFAVPPGGRITFEIQVAARTVGTAPRNLYDGYVSWNLLDITTGWALDFFTGGDTVATVYGRLPFPGAALPRPARRAPSASSTNSRICRPRRARSTPTASPTTRARTPWSSKPTASVVDRYEHVPDKITGFIAALGLMSEIDQVDGKSVSCHGQGVIGRWSTMRVSIEG